MTKNRKDAFIEYVEKMQEAIYQLPKEEVEVLGMDIEDIDLAIEYFAEIRESKVKPVKPLTENGKAIIEYMREHHAEKSQMQSKEIAEGIGVSSRSVAGAMRKLVTEVFVEKAGSDDTKSNYYVLTEKGLTYDI